MPYKLQPRTIQQKFQDYCKKCDAHTVSVRYRDQLIEVPKPKIYCFEAFCCSIGVGEDDLKEYEDNKNYKVTFKDIRFAVLARKLEALVNGEGSASGLIFDLKANYGITVKKTARDEPAVIEVTLDIDGVCGDNLTREGGGNGGTTGITEEKAADGGAGGVPGEQGEHKAADTGNGGLPVTGELHTGAARETTGVKAAPPLQPGIDYPVSLNKQPAPPKPPDPEPPTRYAQYCVY